MAYIQEIAKPERPHGHAGVRARQELEEKWGVSAAAAAPIMMPGGGASAGGAAAAPARRRPISRCT